MLRYLNKALARDLRSVWMLYLKAALFLIRGLGSALVLLYVNPSLTTLVFLSTAIWGFCRFYYFYFYVIDKYIDPGSKHSSLSSFLSKSLLSGRRL